MCLIPPDALERLQQHVEEARQAAADMDRRMADAQRAIDDMRAGYRHVVSCVDSSALLLVLHLSVGQPLERACVALGLPGP